MNQSSRKMIVTLLLLVIGKPCSATIIPTRDRLYSELFKDYNSKTFPVIDHRNPVQISIESFIVSINRFDELSGELALTLYFSIQWREERLFWNSMDFDGIETLLVSPMDIWNPSYYILQSIEKLQELGNISLFLRLTKDGLVHWTPVDEFKLTCSVDVSYFPFDTQICGIEFMAIGYRQEDAVLTVKNTEIDTSLFTNNSQWEVLPSRISNCSDGKSSSCFRINLELKRQSEFYIVYIFVPLVFLGIINNLVFAIPEKCGERNSVAVTTFLSFVVYMSIVNSVIPQSSSPLSYLYIYLMFLMVYSSTIMFLCIVSLRIYNNEGNVPALIRGVVILLRCRCFSYVTFTRLNKDKFFSPKRRKTKAQEENEVMHEGFTDADVAGRKNIDVQSPESESERDVQGERNGRVEITWIHVGKTFDIVCLIVLYTTYFLTTSSIISMICMNKWVE